MKWLGLLCLLACSAMADIVVDRTRILYLAGARSVNVSLTNHADTPRLVQAWIDSGNARMLPEYSEVPFNVTPPILRIEPGKGQALRIALHWAQGQGVALDRETVYWLNVLSIRPTPEGNQLNLAFRTRIKLFLRPEGMDASAQPIQWRLLSQRPLLLEARNDSAVHVTLSRVVLSRGSVAYSSDDPPMIPPKTTLTLPLRGPADASAGAGVLRFSTIDDHGITHHHEQAM